MPDDLDSRLALAEIYEKLDMREEALELVNEGGLLYTFNKARFIVQLTILILQSSKHDEQPETLVSSLPMSLAVNMPIMRQTMM